MGNKGGAADGGAVDKLRRYAEMFDHQAGPGSGCHARRAQTVHIFYRQTRIVQCAGRGAGEDLDIGAAAGIAATGGSDTHDGGTPAQSMPGHVSLSSWKTMRGEAASVSI